MGYITVSEAAKKWGISDRRVRLLCSQDRIEGVIHKGRKYLIPIDAAKPVDERTRKSKNHPASKGNFYEASDRLKEKYAAVKTRSKKEYRKMLDDFAAEFTYNSNAIDGNSLTQKETSMVLEGYAIAKKPLKDQMDAVGNTDAFAYIRKLADQKVPLSENVIKHIHSLTLISNASEKGCYRTRTLKVNDPYVEQVQPYLLKSRMNDLIFENNRRRKKMHPLERIARFHMEFKGIRPFTDANGRTNRLILNLELMEEGYPPINIKFSDRKKYFEAFDTYYRDQDPSPMIEMITSYVEDALLKLINENTLTTVNPKSGKKISSDKEIILTGSMMHENKMSFKDLLK